MSFLGLCDVTVCRNSMYFYYYIHFSSVVVVEILSNICGMILNEQLRFWDCDLKVLCSSATSVKSLSNTLNPALLSYNKLLWIKVFAKL